MKFKTFEVVQGDTIYRIEEDYHKVGAYLYIIENNKCIKDYLQKNIEACKSLAFEEYGIPTEYWNLTEEDNV